MIHILSHLSLGFVENIPWVKKCHWTHWYRYSSGKWTYTIVEMIHRQILPHSLSHSTLSPFLCKSLQQYFKKGGCNHSFKWELHILQVTGEKETKLTDQLHISEFEILSFSKKIHKNSDFVSLMRRDTLF